MKIQDLIIWALFLISIFVVAWYLFGNSPTFEQSILLLILTILFSIGVKVSKIESRLDSQMKGFKKLADDFKEHTKHK